MTEFVLPALLVGVMHFITVHRQDKNELGAATLDALGTKVYKRERVYGGKLGAKIQRAIRTQHSYDADSGCETSEVTSASTENNPDGQKKDTHSIIEGKILASAQAMADAWQDAVDRLADDKVKAIEFDERLRKVVDDYNSRDKLVFTSEVVSDFVNDLSDQLLQILKDLQEDQSSFEKMGISFEEKAFYDILVKVRDDHGFPYADEKCVCDSCPLFCCPPYKTEEFYFTEELPTVYIVGTK